MSDNQYNGWSNYQTWCVHLWLTNEESSQAWTEEQAQECLNNSDGDKNAASRQLALELETWHDDLRADALLFKCGVFSDLLTHALGVVDWREIADALLADLAVEVMP